MNGDQCYRAKKMMGGGADGGCGTEERPCRPSCLKKGWNKDSPEIDFLAQASKALSQRSPFDFPEDGSTSGLNVSNLPSGLANMLLHSDSKKRHKKSHSGAESKKKKSTRQGERSRAANIWVETEEYFRNLALPDIELLSELSSFRSLASRNCFSIPLVGDKPISNGQNNTEAEANIANTEDDVAVKEEAENAVKEEVNDAVIKEEIVEDDEGVPIAELDNMAAESLPHEEKVCSVSDSSSSLEWVLGSRNRILLTTERPSKKRKLLGGDAGFDKIMVVCPCEGNPSLCDFCCAGDSGKYPNRLIVCSSCKATAHQKCYGVHEDVDEFWLCSWCTQKNVRSDFGKPCVLCPKPGGALKRVQRNSGNGGHVEFAHLFCSLWMPEVYIEDLTKMEPIRNLEGIRETRRKLVCNFCKVKSGSCVRCSNGTCRTSFHPICGREAGNRLEVWGKYGCDTIELRAFCSKHSSASSHLPSQSLKKGHPNGNKMAVDAETPVTSSDISGNSDLREMESPSPKLNGPALDSGEAQHIVSGMLGRNNSEEVTLSESFPSLLKKLIDRGKVNLKDVAAEIGINPDALSAKLTEGNLVPDLQCKIVKWLGSHAYMGAWNKGSKVKIKYGLSPKSEIGRADCAAGMTVQESDTSFPTTTVSVVPERKNVCNSSISGNGSLTCSAAENLCDYGIVVNEAKADQLIKEEQESTNTTSIPCGSEKRSTGPDGRQDYSEKHSHELDGDHAKPMNCNDSKGRELGRLEDAASLDQNALQYHGSPVYFDLNPVLLNLLCKETLACSSVHPYICKELMQMQKGMDLNIKMGANGERTGTDFDGFEDEVSRLQASSSASVCCNHHSPNPECNDTTFIYDDRLSKAKELGILDLSPEDEVEGELVYYQRQLLGNTVSRKLLSDGLVCKVAKKLPVEIDVQRQQRWDDVLVNKYFHELREARKQGRKEKRHKEAQAVLAAATAAAAASSRISSLRKETPEESAQEENLLKTITSNRRVGSSSHLMPQAKETLSKMAFSRTPTEKQSDYLQTMSEFSRENPRSCDICRRSETMWNLILVCSSCKVAVHLDCYRCVKETTGPWYCELCEELMSKPSGAPSVNFWEKPYSAAECVLCGGTTGAFRKTTNGQWVHAFCSEWVLESTFRRGQVDLVQGVESVPKGINVCCVCRRKHGACIKCNYGNCQASFHPSCARSAGFYMIGGGKLAHKAYCEKHSLEQKAKAETQKYGAEELKHLKQYRVELERLRLLCERIVKREKIKRDMVVCSQEILAVKRDHIARSLLVRRPFFPADVSSESATTSLNKSVSEAIQRSDDVTVDSTLSVKRRGKAPISLDTDQKKDDSVTSQSRSTAHKTTERPPISAHKATERPPISGKTIPRRHCMVSPSVSEDGKSRKHIETFAKELVMTSDEASLKNRRLPKGYFYVPIDCLQEEKPVKQDAGPEQEDG